MYNNCSYNHEKSCIYTIAKSNKDKRQTTQGANRIGVNNVQGRDEINTTQNILINQEQV